MDISRRSACAVTATVADPSIIEPHEWNTEEHRIDPFPLYDRVRQYDPVYTDKLRNRWVVTRYEDIWNIYKNNEDFSRGRYDPKGKYKFGSESPLGPTILELGYGREHTWSRGIVAGEFVGKRLQSWLPVIQE